MKAKLSFIHHSSFRIHHSSLILFILSILVNYFGSCSLVALPAEALAVAAGPRVAAHVVAALLPEARAVFVEKLHALNPLGRLPSVEARDDEADGAAVFGRDGLAVVRPSEERVFGEEVFDGKVRRPARVVTFDEHEARLRADADQLRDCARRDAAPQIVEPRPARHAVKVGV